MFGINKLLHGWLVCTIFIMHLLWKIVKLTRSLRSLVRLAIFHNSCIKIVRTRQPCSNLYLGQICLVKTMFKYVKQFYLNSHIFEDEQTSK